MKTNWTTKSGKNVEIETTPVGRTFGTKIHLTIDGIKYANARLTTAKGQDVIEFTEAQKANAQKLMITVAPAIVAAIKAESQEAAKLTDAELSRLNRVDTYAENYRKVDQAMSK